MATFIVPVIAEPDYQAFRSLTGGDFPDNYVSWLELIRERSDKKSADGFTTRYAEIELDEFVRYCEDTQPATCCEAAFMLAVEKFLGERY